MNQYAVIATIVYKRQDNIFEDTHKGKTMAVQTVLEVQSHSPHLLTCSYTRMRSWIVYSFGKAVSPTFTRSGLNWNILELIRSMKWIMVKIHRMTYGTKDAIRDREKGKRESISFIWKSESNQMTCWFKMPCSCLLTLIDGTRNEKLQFLKGFIHWKWMAKGKKKLRSGNRERGVIYILKVKTTHLWKDVFGTHAEPTVTGYLQIWREHRVNIWGLEMWRSRYRSRKRRNVHSRHGGFVLTPPKLFTYS